MNAKPDFGTLFFDGNCEFCRNGVMRLRGWLARRGVGIEPFPDEPGAAPPDEMKLRCRDGREFGGADAALALVGANWWGKPLAWIGRLPVVHALLAMAYRWVARRRHCIGGACAVNLSRPAEARARRLTVTRSWWVAGTFTVGAIAGGRAAGLQGWVLMWLIAAAMWMGFKLLALATTADEGWPRGLAGWLGYFLWPGMDAAAFADRGRPKIYLEPAWKCAAVATLRFVGGVLIVGWLAGRIADPVAAGWCAMTGMVLILHFGAFDLLALFWRRVGFDVERLMDAPWRARSLADFWGARWNRAFSHVANRALFRPMTRRFGLAWGTMAGFGLSGVVHELVISVPAGAGYGLPTLYFLAQGAGTVIERRLGWRGTWRGRLLLAVVVLGPAFWLFHPPYMTEVMTPMLEAMGLRAGD